MNEDRRGFPPTRATSHDVARLAGVSQSTVSRVYRAETSVSKATRRLVEAAAAELNYVPNQVARSLTSQRSGMIAVVINQPSSRAYPEILFYLGAEIEAAGFRMLVFTLPADENGHGLIQNLLSYHVDGILSSAAFDEAVLHAYRDAQVPVVMFNRQTYSSTASAVACDHEGGMEVLLQTIAPLLRGPLAVLAGPEGAPVSEARLRGIRASAERRGLGIYRVIHEDYSFEGGRRAADDLLSGGRALDLVVCVNDAMALGLMDTCRFDFGRAVPDDLMVTGFDDIPQAAWPSYGLTSLRQPVRRMAASAVQLLGEMIEQPEMDGETRLLAAELKIRNSTGRS